MSRTEYFKLGLKTVKCDICSNVFRQGNLSHRFCSRRCSRINRITGGRIRNKKVPRPCNICGNLTKNVKFCSRECSFKNQLRIGVMAQKGPASPHYKQDRTEIRRRKALKFFCYGFVRNALGKIADDPDTIIEELGWSPRQAITHIESLFLEGMTWENHGIHGWHVDHIRPISSFPAGTSLAEINALNNLRPLWARDNLSKGAKWTNAK